MRKRRRTTGLTTACSRAPETGGVRRARRDRGCSRPTPGVCCSPSRSPSRAARVPARPRPARHTRWPRYKAQPLLRIQGQRPVGPLQGLPPLAQPGGSACSQAPRTRLVGVELEVLLDDPDRAAVSMRSREGVCNGCGWPLVEDSPSRRWRWPRRRAPPGLRTRLRTKQRGSGNRAARRANLPLLPGLPRSFPLLTSDEHDRLELPGAQL